MSPPRHPIPRPATVTPNQNRSVDGTHRSGPCREPARHCHQHPTEAWRPPASEGLPAETGCDSGARAPMGGRGGEQTRRREARGASVSPPRRGRFEGGQKHTVVCPPPVAGAREVPETSASNPVDAQGRDGGAGLDQTMTSEEGSGEGRGHGKHPFSSELDANRGSSCAACGREPGGRRGDGHAAPRGGPGRRWAGPRPCRRLQAGFSAPSPGP